MCRARGRWLRLSRRQEPCSPLLTTAGVREEHIGEWLNSHTRPKWSTQKEPAPATGPSALDGRLHNVAVEEVDNNFPHVARIHRLIRPSCIVCNGPGFGWLPLTKPPTSGVARQPVTPQGSSRRLSAPPVACYWEVGHRPVTAASCTVVIRQPTRSRCIAGAYPAATSAGVGQQRRWQPDGHRRSVYLRTSPQGPAGCPSLVCQ